jgi:hypothetical protein
MNLDYVAGILLGSLHAMVPITLTASGEVIGQSAGLFNIGLEGIILVSAMTGALGAEAAGPAVGLMVGLGTGFVIGLIFGGVCTYFKGVQLIAGVGINLFAAGLVAFWLIHLGVPGHHAVAAENQLVNIATPYGDFSPMILLAIALPVFIYILLFRTKLGLKIRAVGENPQAASNKAWPENKGGRRESASRRRHRNQNTSFAIVGNGGGSFSGRISRGLSQHRLVGLGHQGDFCRSRLYRPGDRRIQRAESTAGLARRFYIRLF